MYNLYKIVNNINNKIYIGVTSKNIYKRFSRHIYNAKKKSNPYSLLYKAIRKYGESVFSITLIDQCLDKIDAFKKESEYILNFNSKTPYGYNLTNGGEGAPGIKKAKEQFKKHKELYSIPIVREDGTIFPSYTEAASVSNTTVGNIGKVISGERLSAGGYTWKLLNEDPLEERLIERIKRTEKRENHKRKIHCFTNGKNYNSIMEASRALNIDFRQIQAVACGKRKHCKGYKFNYLGEK